MAPVAAQVAALSVPLPAALAVVAKREPWRSQRRQKLPKQKLKVDLTH